ncbi:ABC transporter ATP-binding protein [Alicyclobacillus dauci]|uniref:ABC transporter ATP-binding protein n=1 Tax=Alicyclobacillus dauci TaxID=1475485 RepID=A0ABY6Z2Q9_9BACL|nr:ABC transporter ATP-binding protein [Alicyclobacillus dauci]WAH37182.1 ABC transporter ATP-binding protein [Alicyclobacillus dauci]
MPLLEVSQLQVEYASQGVPFQAVRGVSFTLEDGEFIGIVGESGCGKSTLGFAITRLLRDPGHISGGRVLFMDKDLAQLDDAALQPMRWADFSIVMQSGMNALNPVLTIRRQFEDAFQAHGFRNKREMAERIRTLLRMVKIDPQFADRYPHELSGGMKQRVSIALAMALSPKLIVMDEPTTALDVVVQRSIIQNLKQLRREKTFSAIFISHDLGTVLELADKVAVMYAGQFMEIQSARSILEHPLHPYTKALLKCFPDPMAEHIEIAGIPGSPPDMKRPPKGCPFAPRCEFVQDRCRDEMPEYRRVGDSYVACHFPGVEGGSK